MFESKKIYELSNIDSQVLSFCFIREKKIVALGDTNGNVQLVTYSGNLTRSFNSECSSITSIRFIASTSTIVTASYDGVVKYWDLDFNLLDTKHGPSKWVNSTWISPNGDAIISIGTDNRFIVWHKDINYDVRYLVRCAFLSTFDYQYDDPDYNFNYKNISFDLKHLL